MSAGPNSHTDPFNNLKSANAHSVSRFTIHVLNMPVVVVVSLTFYSFSFKLLSAALDMNVQVHAYSLHFVCRLNRVESVFNADFGCCFFLFIALIQRNR